MIIFLLISLFIAIVGLVLLPGHLKDEQLILEGYEDEMREKYGAPPIRRE
jgi:hypothetical protein